MRISSPKNIGKSTDLHSKEIRSILWFVNLEDLIFAAFLSQRQHRNANRIGLSNDCLHSYTGLAKVWVYFILASNSCDEESGRINGTPVDL